MRSYPEIIGLLDLIEENSSTKSLRFHRLIRDLFHQDAQKRDFATSVLRNSMSKEAEPCKDLVGDTFDMHRGVNLEMAMELEAVNGNYDSSTLDLISIQSILMSSGSDYQIKRSCLEQLTLILFNTSSKRGSQLFKSQVSAGARDLFSFLVHEVNTTHATVQGYLKGQISFLEQSQQSYIKECFKFIAYSAVLHAEEPEVKSFLGKLKQLYLPKDKQDAEDYEKFLNACLFFAGSLEVRSNALKALFVTIFQPVLLQTNVSRQQLPSGQFKRVVQVHVADFCSNQFLMLVPHFAQPLKQPLREDLILSGEQLMFVSESIVQQDRLSHAS